MPCSFRVYIDESGDEGFCFNDGASDWFVLSAVVTSAEANNETVRLAEEVRTLLNKRPRSSLHFRNLKHEQRLPYVQRIAGGRLRTVTVLFHKPTINEPERFRARHQLYRYATRYLLERVSWLCGRTRPRDDPADGSAHIVFSNRSSMKYDEIRDYLTLLSNMGHAWDVRINWDVIKPEQIDALGHNKMAGLQIADAVAAGFYRAVELLHGHNEPRYAQMLKPVVYRHRGTYLGYGLKFWPLDPQQVIADHPELQWVLDEYT